MKENEIRPEKLFDELLRLTVEDIDTFFMDSFYSMIDCPACGKKGSFSFNKNGFNFDECKECKTVYVSPRPDKKSFDNYYTKSKSTKFWSTQFYKSTEKNRREKIWKPKANLINEKIEQFYKNAETIVDIGGGYGVFMEEFLKLKPLDHYVIEPSPDLAKECRNKKLNVIEKFLENIAIEDFKTNKKVFVSFELFEHLHDPKEFLNSLKDIMQKDELFIFTTLSGTGVDIQTLWTDSKAISPPMHLNFFNPKSIELLLKDTGFKVLNVTTPGKLDIDIMDNNKDKVKDRFWKNFLEYSNDAEKENMQKFISENLLSSHMMIISQKV